MHTPQAPIQHAISQQQRKWRNIFWTILALFIFSQTLELWASEPSNAASLRQSTCIGSLSTQSTLAAHDGSGEWLPVEKAEVERFSF